VNSVLVISFKRTSITDKWAKGHTHTWRCQNHCSGVYCLSFGLV